MARAQHSPARRRLAALWAAGLAALPLACARAADPLAPRLPWDEGGWPARSWIGLAIEVTLFLVLAAVILRLGRPVGSEPERQPPGSP